MPLIRSSNGTIRKSSSLIRRASDGDGKVEPGIEKYSVLRAVNAIQRADVVLLVIDALDGVTSQDEHVANFILEAQKSAIVVVNKWDAVPDKTGDTMTQYTSQIRERLNFMDFVPIEFVSALTAAACRSAVAARAGSGR